MICDYFGYARDSMMKLIGNLSLRAPVESETKENKVQWKERKKPEDGNLRPQKLLLTWMIEETRLFPTIKKYIQPQDFSNQGLRQVAVQVYQQLETGKVDPAGIIDLFPEEEQRQVAELFSAQLEEIETKQDKEKALKDLIIRVKTNSYEMASSDIGTGDLSYLTKLVAEKRGLEELKKIEIHLYEE